VPNVIGRGNLIILSVACMPSLLEIDSLDQWCLRRILNIRWYQHVFCREVWWITEPVTSIIQKRHLTLFWHLEGWMSQQMPGELLQQFLRVIWKGRQDVLTPPGWPLWRMTYHFVSSVWKMPLSWCRTSHSGDIPTAALLYLVFRRTLWRSTNLILCLCCYVGSKQRVKG